MTRKLVAFSATTIVLLACTLAVYFWYRPVPTDQPDHLCEYVRSRLGLTCPFVIAARSVMSPGAITQTQADSLEGHSFRAKLPTAYLSSESCLIPGQTVFVPEPTCPSGKEVASFAVTYDLSRSLTIGADLPLPKLPDVTLKAGPNLSSIRKVEVKTTGGCYYQLDENVLIDLIESCAIRPQCVERIRRHDDKVVSTAFVANDFSYDFIATDDRRFSFQAALKNEMLNIEAGSSSSEDARNALSGTTPMVIGVDFIRPRVLEEAEPCSATATYQVSGSSTVSIGGGGGGGNIGAQQSASGGFAAEAKLAKEGSESSECEGSFERTKSGASASALVGPGTDEGSLSFGGRLLARGGHFATCAGCGFFCSNNCCGKTGHDNSANASAVLTGTVSVVVRAAGAATIRVTWSNMPPGTTLALRGVSTRPVEESFSIDGTGQRDFEVPDLGTYTATATLTRSVSANGAGSDSAELSASLRAALQPNS